MARLLLVATAVTALRPSVTTPRPGGRAEPAQILSGGGRLGSASDGCASRRASQARRGVRQKPARRQGPADRDGRARRRAGSRRAPRRAHLLEPATGAGRRLQDARRGSSGRIAAAPRGATWIFRGDGSTPRGDDDERASACGREERSTDSVGSGRLRRGARRGYSEGNRSGRRSRGRAHWRVWARSRREQHGCS